ncbi:armadillo repeat-containing protein 3 [Ctenocephalides felis]|uniref:armadillo repeat-containing protein 3 n=1 Tax=Ctenocephalides felis TaxID=7515 RepID=UPI000E6E503C|nr:armadillo repeat-containing protein 3 [Ctenocephalides felis]
MTESSSKTKSKLISKERVDRNSEEVINQYDPIAILAENCRTVILMLDSPEEKIVLQAICSIDKHAMKGEQACHMLLRNYVLQPLPPLLVHDNICIKRFSIKLMQQLSKIEHVKENLLNFTDTKFYHNEYNSNEDLHIQEYAAGILGELTRDIRGCDLLLKQDVIATIFRRINSTDADVQRNTLEDYNLLDLHAAALSGISAACEDNHIAEIIVSEQQTPRIVAYFEDAAGEMRISALQAMANLAEIESGRKELLNLHATEQMINVLTDNNSSMDGGSLFAVACNGLANMSVERPASYQIVNSNALYEMYDALNNSTLSWGVRETIAESLNKILENNVQACKKAAYFHGHRGPARRTDLRVKSCECLTMYLCEENMRRWLPDTAQSLSIASDCLRDDSSRLKVSAAAVVRQAAEDPQVAQRFISSSVLQCLLDDAAMRKACPIWESAIEVILNNHLPAKFAYTGKLEISDVIRGKFYLMRKPWISFPLLEEILSIENACPKQIIYLVEEITLPDILMAEFQEALKISRPSRKRSNGSKASADGARAAKRPTLEKNVQASTLQGENASADDVASTSLVKMAPPSIIEWKQPSDPHIQMYLNKIRRKFMQWNITNGSSSSFKNGMIFASTIPIRAKIVAHFVHARLSGPTPKGACSSPLLEMHLTNLKHELQTSIIPLGYLRLGAMLERSLLFKVLSDKLGIPCTLVRGENGRSWNEIAIPVIEESSTEEWLSIKLLRPSHIVDLMVNPGEVLQLGSWEAENYQGLDFWDL